MRGGKGLVVLFGTAIFALAIAACAGEEDTPTPTAAPVTPTVAAPSPAATPTPRSGQTPIPAPTRAAEAAPTAAPTPVVQSGPVYHNTLYGFSVAHHPEWTVEENKNPSAETPVSVVATFKIPDAPDLGAKAFIFYYPQRQKPSEIADQELSSLAGFPAFRAISQTDVTLKDGSEAHQVLYGFGTGQDEQRGALIIAARGSQVPILQVVGPRTVFERNLEKIDTFLTSLRLETPKPFGVPRDQALVLSMDQGPITLDPAIAQESRSIHYIGQVFSGLAALDAELKVVPDLATWEVSPDGLTYTFQLNQNATFHSGKQVRARDVVYSWERAASPALKSPTARTYLGDIVGMNDVLAGKAEHASGLKAVDDRTLQVTIDSPKVYFLSKLTHVAASVVDEENVKTGAEWWKTPNGTGPFRLKDWVPSVAMHLERYDKFYGTPAKVSHIIHRLHAGFPVRMFEDGEIDAALLSLAEANTLKEEKSPLVAEMVTSPQLSVTFIGFNTSIPPFDDPAVRRAFLLALDRKAIVEETLEGIGTLAQGFLPPGLPGHDPNLPPIAYSPAEAKTLLDGSKYRGAAGLPEIVITLSGRISPHIVRMAQMWQQNLGVSIKVQVLPTNDYYYKLNEQVKNLYDYGWVADYPDPHNFLDVLFHTGTDNNVGKFSSTEVDNLLEQARLEKNSARRTDLYRQVERIARDQAVAIPLWFGQDRLLVKPYLEGFKVDAQGQVDLSGVSLKPRG